MGRDLHRSTSRLLSIITLALGIAVIATTVTQEDGLLSIRMVLGVLLVGAGAGRFYVESRRL
jgi:uncharacterized membrane protein